jgi:transmembrane sensor
LVVRVSGAGWVIVLYNPTTMDDEKIIAYIRGDIKSENEILEILNWVESSEEHQKKYNQLKNLWVLTGFNRIENAGHIQFKPEKRSLFTLNWKQVAKYAAVFILALLSASVTLFLLNKKSGIGNTVKYAEIHVPNGEKTVITLSDCTKVWLNSGTTLRYPEVFDKKERKVFVIGEAYFEVAKNPDQPFIVNAGLVNIKVLGTHFNISAYPDEQEIQATLVEGSINATNISTGKGIILTPGQQAIYSRDTKKMSCANVQTSMYTSWKDKRLQFENTELSEVIKKMERWYGVTIIADKSINLKSRYTFTIQTESLEKILHLMVFTNQISYNIKNDTVTIKKLR